MDLPATQAIDEEFISTQEFITNKYNEKTVVGILLIESKQYLILSGITTVGRHPGCTIVINHETVSKKHAEIESESVDGPFFIKDLNSCNMTKINNTKLRSNSCYQIKDGDKLSFGQVIATFKIYSISDDSFIASTPQMSKIIRSVMIPGTPDSLINASTSSESDMSAIPEIKIDKTSISIKSSEILIRTSMNDKQINKKLADVNLDRFSFFSKNKNSQENINEIQTPKYSKNYINEDFNNTNYITEIKKCDSLNKCNESDENIYEMETQRPFNEDDNKYYTENQEISQFNYKKSNYNEKTSNDLTIYNIDTQKVYLKPIMSESTENPEIQQFDHKKADFDEIENINLKILNKSIENLETQQFICRTSDCHKKKTNDISIYNAETQKINPEIPIDLIEDLETQRISCRLLNSIQEKSNDKNQQSFCIDEKEEINSEEVGDQSIENMETQKLHFIKPVNIQTSNLIKREFNYKCLDKMPDITMNTFSQDDKIHYFNYEKSDFNKKEVSDKSIYNSGLYENASKTIINESVKTLETQKFNVKKSNKFELPNAVKIKFNNKLCDNVENQKNILDELETQDLEHMKLTNLQNNETDNSVSEILVDECKKTTTDNKHMKSKVLLDKNIKDSDIQYSEELFDSGFRTSEQESDPNKSNSVQSMHNNTLQLQILNSSFNPSYENKLSCSSTSKQFEKSTVVNTDVTKDIINDKDEDEIFCSQNLIQDYSFISEQVHINDQSFNTESVKIQKCKSKHKSNNIIVTSANIDNKNIKENQIKKLNKNDNGNSSKQIIQKQIASDSETDEEGNFSNYLSKEINENSNINNIQNKLNFNEEKIVKNYTNGKNEENLNSSKNQTIPFKYNNILLDSTTTDSEDSMFGDCDDENKHVDQEIQNYLHTPYVNQNENTKKLSHSYNKKIDKYSSEKTEDINCIPNQILNKTASTNLCKIANNINNVTDNNFLVSTHIIERQSSPSLEEFNDFELLSTKNKMVTQQYNEPNQLINKIKQKISNSSMTKRQLEELDTKCSKKYKDDRSFQNEQINLNTSIERNLDKIFKEHQQNSVKKETIILTQRSPNNLESNQIEDNQNIDLNSIVLSPTLSTKRNNKVKKNLKAILPEKSYSICQQKKSVINLNDTIEQNLNEMFNNTINTIEEYKPDAMLTQQLKSVLQSQDDNESNNKGTISENKSLDISMNSEKKYRLSLSMNISNLTPKKNKEIQCLQSSTYLNQSLDKPKTAEQESKLNENSQDTEIYFTNLKCKRKHNLFQDSQSEDELEKFQILDKDKKIVKKQKYTSHSTIEKVINTKDNNNQNYDIEILYKTPKNSFKVNNKKRLSLTLSKSVNLNLSQIMKDQEVEKEISEEQQDHAPSLLRINLLDESNNSMSKQQPKNGDVQNFFDESNQNLQNHCEQHQSSFKKVGTPNNTSLTTNEIINTDDCANSDDDFLKSMPEIKVAGTVECPATNSQLAAMSDNDFDDEDRNSASISPLDIVIPTKWNWYAKKRYDLIYRKKQPIAKIESSNFYSGSTSTATKVSGLNKILTKIDSIKKLRVSKNSKNSISNADNIRYSTRSRHSQRTSLVKSFQATDKSEYDSNSEIDSDSIFESIIPKYKSLEPMKLNLVCNANDESDEEFELLRKRCEKMLAVPSVYDKNCRVKVKNYNAKIWPSGKGNHDSFKVMYDYHDVNNDKSDHDSDNRRKKRSNRIKTDDEDAIVFQVSAGDPKDNTMLKIPGVYPLNNKTHLESEADNNDHNHPIELTKNNEIVNIQHPFKLQEVSVLISPLRENVLSRFNAEHHININNNIKSNFKQSGSTDDTSTRRKLSKSPKTSAILFASKKNRNEIENENRSIKILNQKVLNCKRSKINTLLEFDHTPSKENLLLNNFDTSQIVKVQRNKTARSSVLEKSRQNRNKDVALKKKSKSKIKDIQESEKSQYLKNLNIIITKDTKNRRNKTTEELNIENTKISNSTRTRSTKIRDVKGFCLNTTKSSENNRIIRRRFKDINNSNCGQVKHTSNINIKNRKVKDIKDINLEKSQITNNTIIKNKSDIIYNQFSNSCDNNNKNNLSVENNNTHSYSMRTRKRLVNSSKEFQEVANILKNIRSKDSKNKKLHKEITKNNLKNNSENRTSDLDNVFDKSLTRIKRTRQNISVKNRSISENNKVLKKDLFRNSKKQNIPSTTILNTHLRSRRLVSTSLMKTYNILFTGDKSKVYKETVTKLGGTVTEDPAKCTILVTDKIRRTFKFLCSVARGIPIVSLNWLDDSIKAHHFLNWENYILQDRNTETEFKFKLTESLKKTKNKKLFEGYTIILTPHIIQPPISELKEMIIFSGGKCLLRAPRKWSENTIIITKKDDIQRANKLISKAPISITIHSIEFILTGILRQDINLEEFKLS